MRGAISMHSETQSDAISWSSAAALACSDRIASSCLCCLC
jgi:hypothetical protein